MPIFDYSVAPSKKNDPRDRRRFSLGVPSWLTPREKAAAMAVQFANWFTERFFTGFVWGFAFMLGLWVFGTLVGLR